MKRLALTVILLAAGTSAEAARLPGCAGPAEISGAQLLRVERNGVVVIADGRALVLEGIRLPQGAADHAPSTYADTALSTIATLAAHTSLSISAIPPKEDRYGRVRGQLVTGDGTWIQSTLLEKGLARVAISPDRTECAAELYAAEGRARSARVGLWADPAYAVRSPNGLAHDVGTFQIVQGRVVSADVKNGRAYLNFGADWTRDFTVTISPDDMAGFRRAGVDPRAYQGQTIRVRGLVQWHDGPEVEISNPQGVEVVP